MQNGIFMEFESEVKHLAIFHEEFYISSTLDNKNSQTLYSYLIGCSEAQRDDRTMKVLGYKDISLNAHLVTQKPEKMSAKNPVQQSDFCRINP